MIEVGHNTFDPTGLNVSGAKRGQTEHGDLFADIFGRNFEPYTEEVKPSVRQSKEQQVLQAEAEPEAIAKDENVTTDTDDVQAVEETNEAAATDDVEVKDSQAADQPDDSPEAVDDEGEVVEEEMAVQTTVVATENVVLLEQLAGEIKTQGTPQQVVNNAEKVVDVPVKSEPKIPQPATQVKVMVPEEAVKQTDVDKVEIKSQANAVTIDKATAVTITKAVDERVLVEHAPKVAVKEVTTGQVVVEVNVDQDDSVDPDEAQQVQVKDAAKNKSESLSLDIQSDTRGSTPSDLSQRQAKTSSEAEPASGVVAEVVTKEQKVAAKKTESPLITSIREISTGKVETGKTIMPESRSASAESLFSREQTEQVVKAARIALSRGMSQVQLRLDPPELGHLRIEIKQNASGMQLQLQATTARAHQLLEQSSGHLRTALESQGFQTTQIEVQLRMDLRNDQAMDQQQTDQFNQGQELNQEESFSDNFEESFQEQLADSEAEAEDSDLNVQEVLEHQSGSRSPEHWREMEFSNLDVVI